MLRAFTHRLGQFRHRADLVIDSHSPHLPLWLAKWAVYVTLGVVFLAVAAYFSYNIWFFKPPVASTSLTLTPASLQASDYQVYASLEACSSHHPSKLCRHALAAVKAMTIAQLPLYPNFATCSNLWQFCFNLDTGPASGSSSSTPVVVSLPAVKGFAIAWKGDEILSVVPAFINRQAKLVIVDPAVN